MTAIAYQSALPAQTLPVSPANAVYAVCHTPFFAINATNNSHMSAGERVYHADPEAYSKLTQTQLKGAHRLMHRFLGAALEYVDPNPHLADQVYTADPGMFHINGDGELIAVLSNFRFKDYRGGEVKHFRAVAEKLGATIVQIPDHLHWEGSGDTVVIRDPKTQAIQAYLMGCGPRSDEGAAAFLQDVLKVRVVPVPLRVASSPSEQSGFHMDTATMQPGSEAGHLVIHRPVITEEGLARIKSVVPESLWLNISDHDATAMGTNGVVLGNKVLLHDVDSKDPTAVELAKLASKAGVDLTAYALSTKYKRQLGDIGCNVKTTDLTTIILGGGSGKCGSNPVTNAVSQRALHLWLQNRNNQRACA
ncbi:MAG: hypothetical protein EYC62_06815 [Alphaproteobacteria bacterium]|nr:MAG: hypothetical protein EYC62_06815 [Alphaproteobacteria bacterium]